MKRIASDGHDNNTFTEGNPSLGVPATVVSAIWANNVQEELALLVEGAGLTVDQTGATLNQVLTAIGILQESGGTTNASMAIVDAQAAAADVTAIPAFDKTKVKSAKMLVDVSRRDDGQNSNELFELSAIYDPEADTWSLNFTSQGDDAGVVFSITGAGQVQYVSDSYAGANYAGTLRVSHVKKLAL